ncbi:MAG: hypothetical protein D6677_04655 [Calditrichaeota bacterium]|nr:MAG: hypothetical protein D6677_04655 [Calditrichota bacterium]
MGPIRNLFSTSPDLKRTDPAKKAGKSNEQYKKNEAVSSVSTGQPHSRDQVEISSEGRELLSLKAEARKYLDDVKTSKTLTPQELDKIKEKIASRRYFDDSVIEKVVDKLVQSTDIIGE